MNNLFYFIIIFVSFLCRHLHAEDRPNIVLILADDMGYSDIGAYGGEIKTPHIDELAQQGLNFTNFYNNAKCGPSRLALHTGHYPGRGFNGKPTFAEILKNSGYRTIMTGKWHQGSTHPTQVGYDRYTGLLDGCCNFWNPGIDAKEGEPMPGRKPQMVKANKSRKWGIEDKAISNYVPKDKDFYTTDVFSNYAVDRLEEYKNEEQPFLLYLAYTAPHYPLHAWPEDIKKYENTYKQGWDKLREQRLARIKDLGLVSTDTVLPPRNKRVKAWNELTKDEQADESYKMAVYAAMVDRMDQGIGKVLQKLKDIGKYDNTIVIFLSDNGACAEIVDQDVSIPAGPVESYRALGRGWAMASNTPLRDYKANTLDGGVRTPLIISWPKVIKHSTISQEVGHVMDFLPTFMELAKGEYPAEIRGKKTMPLVGQSLVPTLRGEPRKGYQQLFWKYGTGRAVIKDGEWKLVKTNTQNSQWELYNIRQDFNELNNLALEYPDRVSDMAKSIKEWELAYNIK